MNYTLKLNEKMKKCLAVSAFGLLMCGLSFTTTAQSTVPQQAQQQSVKTDYSDSQLKQFLDVNKKLQPLQQTAQQHIVKSIQNSGLTVDRFREIAQSQQDGKGTALSAQDSTAFNKAAQEIMQEKGKTDSQMVAVIKKEGMDLETFQGIAMAYQQSPEIQQKINKLLGTQAGSPAAQSGNADSTGK